MQHSSKSPKLPQNFFSSSIFYLVLFLLSLPQLTQSCSNGLNGCKRCKNSTNCAKCDIGYRMNYALVCQPCFDPGCASCNGGSRDCNLPKPGYGFVNGQILACLDPTCKYCHDNNTICSDCQDDHAINSTFQCKQCRYSHCALCTTFQSCDTCRDGYYLNPPLCLNSTVPYCKTASGPGTCTQCIESFSLQGLNCFACLDPACINCTGNINQCIECSQGYGPSGSACVQCAQNCSRCSYNNNQCIQCLWVPYLGLAPVTGTCLPCTDSNCLYCQESYTDCMICHNLYGFDVAGDCHPCPVNCLYCKADYTICNQCSDGLGWSGSACLDCTMSSSQCLTCDPSDSTKCLTCPPGYYLDANDICRQCLPNCQVCTSTTCTSCVSGFGLDTGNSCSMCNGSLSVCLQCQPTDFQNCTSCTVDRYLAPNDTCILCPEFCTACSWNDVYGEVQCSACINSTFSLQRRFAPICRPICGDLIIVGGQQCDNQLGRPYDGCSDICEIEDNFTCFQSITGNVCSYNGTLSVNFIDFNQDKQNKNQVTITVQIFPPLYVFKETNVSQLALIFSLQSDYVDLTSVSFDALTGKFQFVTETKQNIPPGTAIFIEYNPLQSSMPEYSLGQNLTIEFVCNRMLFYYSNADIAMGKANEYICYVIVALGWVGVILGVFLRRLPGLEAMFVIQIAYFSIVYVNSYLLFLFEQTFPLKYATGLNLSLISEDVIESISSPYLTQFKLSEKLLINNFNISIAFELLSLLFILVSYLRLRKFTQNRSFEYDSESEDSKQLDSLMSKYELGYQLLMTAVMLNLIYFVACCCIFFTSDTIIHAVSLVVFSLHALITLGTFVKFFIDPTVFVYFRYSFKVEELAMKHYFIHVAVLSSAVLLLQMLVKVSWADLLPPGVMIVYTLAYRPYKELLENIRSAFNYFVVFLLLFYRVYLKYLCKDENLNSSLSVILFMVNLIAVGLVAVIGIVFTSWYYYYYEIKLPKEELEQAKNMERLVEEHRRKLLREFVRIDPNKNIQMVELDTTFKQIIDKNNNLVNQTNRMQQNLMLKIQRQKLSSTAPLKLNNIELTNISFSKKCKQMMENEIINKQPRKLIETIRTPTESVSRDLLIFKNQNLLSKNEKTPQNPKIQPSYYQSVVTLKAPAGPSRSLARPKPITDYAYKPDPKKQLCVPQLKKQLAKEIVICENDFINLESAVGIVKKEMNEMQNMNKDKMEEDFEEYNKIDIELGKMLEKEERERREREENQKKQRQKKKEKEQQLL